MDADPRPNKSSRRRREDHYCQVTQMAANAPTKHVNVRHDAQPRSYQRLPHFCTAAAANSFMAEQKTPSRAFKRQVNIQPLVYEDDLYEYMYYRCLNYMSKYVSQS